MAILSLGPSGTVDPTITNQFEWTTQYTQTHYQLKYKIRDSGVWILNTGRVTSTAKTYSITANTLSKNEEYEWSIRYWYSTLTSPWKTETFVAQVPASYVIPNVNIRTVPLAASNQSSNVRVQAGASIRELDLVATNHKAASAVRVQVNVSTARAVAKNLEDFYANYGNHTNTGYTRYHNHSNSGYSAYSDWGNSGYDAYSNHANTGYSIYSDHANAGYDAYYAYSNWGNGGYSRYVNWTNTGYSVYRIYSDTEQPPTYYNNYSNHTNSGYNAYNDWHNGGYTIYEIYGNWANTGYGIYSDWGNTGYARYDDHANAGYTRYNDWGNSGYSAYSNHSDTGLVAQTV